MSAPSVRRAVGAAAPPLRTGHAAAGLVWVGPAGPPSWVAPVHSEQQRPPGNRGALGCGVAVVAVAAGALTSAR